MNYRSKKEFRISDYADIYAANNACSRYTRQFTEGMNGAPRLWVKFDKDSQSYYVEPNDDFMPRNIAWQHLQEYENLPANKR